MRENERPYHEMDFIDGNVCIMLNRCSICSRFSVPYEVGQCEFTPENNAIDECECFQNISQMQFHERICVMMLMQHPSCEWITSKTPEKSPEKRCYRKPRMYVRSVK